jgi:hypothetical protein
MLTNYVKVFLFLVASTYVQAQKIHHQMIASQGSNVRLVNGMLVNQSVGQQSPIGNYSNSKVIVGQGYIQSMVAKAKNKVVDKNSTAIVYQNPFVNELNFKFSTPVDELIKASFFDIQGRLIFSQEKHPINDVLILSELYFSEGTYFIKLETQNFIYSTQIIKTR